MPSRPTFLLRSIAQPPSPWTCQSCLRQTRPLTRPLHASFFHNTARRQSDSLPNHYDTLQLASTATPAEIKRQFYTLSKKHHPDRNPDDATASTRFVAISEAYHVLAVPEKRAQYDAQLNQAQGRGSRWGGGDAYPQGSYSSAAFGSRPASGLNKKRSTFRGPPPSFYKSGGYGKHGAKRAEHAYNSSESGQAGEEAPRESYGDFGGGFGPGQHKQGHQVPHFDDRRHKETHDSINEHIWARRQRARRTVRAEEELDRGGMLMNFIMVTGVLGVIGLTVKIFGDYDEAHNTKRRGDP